MGERLHEGFCVCMNLHAWMRGTLRLQRQENEEQILKPFQKCAKSAKKVLCVRACVSWAEFDTEIRLPVSFSGCFSPACLCVFHPCLPWELKKKLCVTGDTRKELLSQHFSSVPQPEACQAERRLLHASTHTRPHAHTCTREVLESKLSIIQLHSLAMAPSRSCLFGFAAEKKRPFVPSLFKQRWKGDKTLLNSA